MGAICIALFMLVAQASAHIGRHRIELPDVSIKTADNHKGKGDKGTADKIKIVASDHKITNKNAGKSASNRDSNTQRRLKITEFAQQNKVEPSSSFGKRKDPINKRNAFHKGIDISRPIGTEVFAWSEGVVVQAQWLGDYGLTVDVRHPNGVKTRYAHLQQTNVREGQRLNKGQTIGQVGLTGRTTGANLHFEIMVAGKLSNPKKHLSDDIAIVGGQKRKSI